MAGDHQCSAVGGIAALSPSISLRLHHDYWQHRCGLMKSFTSTRFEMMRLKPGLDKEFIPRTQVDPLGHKLIAIIIALVREFPFGGHLRRRCGGGLGVLLAF